MSASIVRLALRPFRPCATQGRAANPPSVFGPPSYLVHSAGVDVADVRAILKLGLGCDIGELLNELGRASRDGEPARIVLFVPMLRRPRTAPHAPTEAQVLCAYHSKLWAHGMAAELASGRSAWAVFRAAFGEPPAAALGPVGAEPSVELLLEMVQLLLALLQAHSAVDFDGADPALTGSRAPPRGAFAAVAEAAVSHVGPRSGELQDWVHHLELRRGATP